MESVEQKQREQHKRVNKIDKPVSKLTTRWKENAKINKIRQEKGNIITDTKPKESLGHNSKTCTALNWKI